MYGKYEEFSIDMDPFFHIPIENVAPPAMHIVLGLANNLICELELRCKAIDSEQPGNNVEGRLYLTYKTLNLKRLPGYQKYHGMFSN
uniref:Uncharacterized protein n=1 Tax=Acrobeloides nanus TaxID=290746 RepID=A0A914D5L0_9BILA